MLSVLLLQVPLLIKRRHVWSLTPPSTVKPYTDAQWLVSLSRPAARYVVNTRNSHVGFEDANAHRVHTRVYVCECFCVCV